MKKCKICDEKRDYTIQLGSDKDLLFCNICGYILAKGLKILDDAGEINIIFGDKKC